MIHYVQYVSVSVTVKGPFAGVDYNLTLCPLQSRLQHIYVALATHMPESTVTLYQSRLYHPVRDFGFGFWTRKTIFVHNRITNRIFILESFPFISKPTIFRKLQKIYVFLLLSSFIIDPYMPHFVELCTYRFVMQRCKIHRNVAAPFCLVMARFLQILSG